MFIIIDGETLSVNRICTGGYPPTIETDGGEYVLAESREAAGKAARDYWHELVTDYPLEAAGFFSEETLIAWALGQRAGPGTRKVSSLNEWLDLWLDTPEEHWAGYDGVERDVTAPAGFDADRDPDDYPEPADDTNANDPAAVLVGFARLFAKLGFVPAVAYRN